MTSKTLIEKLRLQPGQRALVVNAPEGYLDSLCDLPQAVEVDQEPEDATVYDFVQLFVTDSAELAQLAPRAMAAARHDAVFWLCYPKRSSQVQTDLSRDLLWDQLPGLRPVSQVSVDAIWSAMRFRPEDRVGK